MLLLKKIRIINWHFFSDETIEIGPTTLFTGDNGTGKSTIIDAIQYALVARIDRIKFNAAATDRRTGRNLDSYLRCKIGAEALDFVRGDCISHVMLEFADGENSFCAGIMAEAFTEGQPREHQWVLEKGRITDVRVFDEGSFLPPRIFRDSIKEIGGSICATKSEYNARLTHLLKVYRRNTDFNPYLEAVVRSVNFSPFTSVHDFVCDYILEERQVDISAMRENLQNYKEAEREAIEMETKIGRLSEIRDTTAEAEKISRQIIMQEYFRRRIDVEAEYTVLHGLKNRRENREKDCVNLESKISELKERREGLFTLQQETQFALSRNDTHMLYERLNRGLSELSERISSEKIRADRFETLKSQCVTLTGRELADDLALEIATVGEEARLLVGTLNRLEVELDGHKRDFADLSIEKKELESGILRYPDEAMALKAAMEKNGIPAALFSDQLEVKDEEWHNAIEAWLNTQRFSLLVPETDFQKALRLYDKQPLKTAGVGIPNLMKMHDAEALNGSLAEVVEARSPAARRYAAFLLGEVMRAELDTLKNHNKAITKSCMRYANHTAVRVREEVYGRWYIGREAKRRRQEQLVNLIDAVSVSIEKLLKEIYKVKEREEILSRVYGTLHDMRTLEDAGERMEVLAKEWTETKRKLDGIDTSTFDELKLQLAAFAESIRGLEKELEELNRALGSARNEAENLGRMCAESEGRLNQLSAILAGFEAEYPDLAGDFVQYFEERMREEKKKTRQVDFGGIQSRYESVVKNFRTRLDNLKRQLSDLKRKYNADFHVYIPEEDAASSGFISLLKQYAETELPEYRDKIARARQEAERQFKEHFVSRLNEYILEAKESFKEINYILNLISFGQDQYHFTIQEKAEKKVLLEVIRAASEIRDYEGTMFESLNDDRQRVEVERLFEGILGNDLDSAEVRDVCDYRQYFQYDIRIRQQNTTDSQGRPLESYLSKVLREKSGGETQTPYYVAIAASFYRFYKDDETAIRLVLFDEAFNKMDDERIGSIIDFFKRLRMQIITAVPTEKTESIARFMDTVNLVFRRDYRAYIRDYTILMEN